MSQEKSTIDRPSTASPEATPLSASPALHRAFDLLERWSPRTGGRLAEHLWFRLPDRPPLHLRERRTPPGGEPFEVAWDFGVVRGRVYGDWGNPTAYLVHGWGGWWQQLSAYVQPLVEAGLCVVAFDGPSHGASGPGRLGPRSSTVVELAQALVAVTAEFGRPAVIIGHSAGALAVLYARELGAVADSYALVAPPDSIKPMMRRFSSVLGVGPRSAAHMLRLAERRAGLPLSRLDMVAAARGIEVPPPLLVVHDRRDQETPAAGSVALTDAWPGSDLVLTDGLGHRRILWEPTVAARVVEFAAVAAAEVRRSSR